jgi:hypothetical protein
MNQDTCVVPSLPPAGEFGLLARLAFASRARVAADTHAPRHLAFLPPDALDMDLSDPMQRDFGDYELLEKIGQGGMGVVYRARQHGLDREVALKLLAAGPWASTEFIERFRREAQSAARLEHPNIVTVFEAGSQHDLHYFSMRLVRGESLAALLQREGRLAPRAAARLLRVVADALDYAHRLGVLHLDLKPGNVLVDTSGEPLVADFGLARRIDQALAEDGDEVSGTPSYMAPEQAVARSQRIGMATDIYGLGAILYELLTGRPPFLEATPQATLESVVHGETTAPRVLRPSIPPDLEAICLKCLQKEPQARYPSANALAEDLRRFLDDRPVSVRQPSARERIQRWVRRDPKLAGAAAIVALSLATGLIATSQQWRRAEDNAATSRELLWEGRRTAALRLQQDGKGHEALPLLIDNLREAEEAGAAEAIAREQQRIGLLTGQGAVLVDRIAIEDANPFALELSPDGRVLAIAFNDLSVRWYDTDGLRERGRVTLADRASSSGSARLPALLRFAGPSRLLVTLQWYSNLPHPTDSDSWLVDLETARVVEPPDAFAGFSDATFSADARHALLRNHARQSQWWQVEPWRPLSPLTRADVAMQPWVLDPGSRFALRFEVRQEYVDFLRLPDFRAEAPLHLPQGAGISAWALSRDGRTLALGDFEGRAFLLDTRSRALRPLPNARGREITWLGFSEDDAWIASATFDGIVFAYEVASGDPLHAGQMRHDFAPRRLGLSRAQRLLIVAGEGDMALWRLARAGPRAAAPQRVGTGPAPHALAGLYATGWSLQTGLLATAGIDGQVRLWRLPTSPTVPARTARQRSDRLEFDGRRLVDVEGDRLRLIDPKGRALGDWRQYPQAPGFAELVDQGRLLLTTVGPRLQFEDAVTGRAVAPAQDLPASPQRLLASPDGSRVLLSFGEHGEEGFQERLMLYDTRRGTRLGADPAIAGPIRRYAFAPDGRRLLAVGPRNGSTGIFDATTLERVADYPHDPFEPVQWAEFMEDGTVLLATQAADARLGQDALRRWDPVQDELCGEVFLPPSGPIGTIALGTDAFLAGTRMDLHVSAEGIAVPVARQALSESNAILALDAGRTLLARAHRHEVQLFDARTLAPLGPPLVADITALDTISQLAFAPDGRRLVANTWLGYWMQWSTAADPRDAASLAADLAPLSPETEHQRVLIAPSAAERTALRRRDPGPWPAPEARPLAPDPHFNARGEPVPRRPSGLPPQLVDLTAYYNNGPDSVRNFYYNVRPSLHPMPVGRQRIGGIEFDIRGLIQVVNWEASVTHPDDEARLDCIPLDGQTASAVHLLLDVSLREPVPQDTVLARLRLHYEDGSDTTLALQAGRHLPSYSGDDGAVPRVFAGNPLMAAAGLEDQPFSAPRLANPHPERALRCLGLEPSTVIYPLALLAITLESPAVIPPPQSGSSP